MDCSECGKPGDGGLVTHPITRAKICHLCARRTVPVGYMPEEYARELIAMWDDTFVRPDVEVKAR